MMAQKDPDLEKQLARLRTREWWYAFIWQTTFISDIGFRKINKTGIYCTLRTFKLFHLNGRQICSTRQRRRNSDATRVVLELLTREHRGSSDVVEQTHERR